LRARTTPLQRRCSRLISSGIPRLAGMKLSEEELLDMLLEAYKRSRRPSRRIGYIRVKRVLGEVIGYKDKGEAEEGGEGG